MMSKKGPDLSIERKIAKGAWWVTKSIGGLALATVALSIQGAVNFFRDEKVSYKPYTKHTTKGVPDSPDVPPVIRTSPYHRIVQALPLLIDQTPEERAADAYEKKLRSQERAALISYDRQTTGLSDGQQQLVIAERANMYAGRVDPSSQY